ncbi:LacI family DNA-binding transcriptional regulator [Neobacillus thermocopriae]|uniref:LacI family transcriptional regulator n=1 Tax=Neobacillus thermocopriae TaxID=1215031 RepID=A0A6B3TS83_9BACI|nr:LacI family DNA-binding transcriptional regulator [Neobacillus thermocopriae]MED3623473.1 LacI family DNA-binding transcriptional regulator [Neobacillus thermocopriae]MED3715219.1 LacI family DNA-binding transcriptional regulator [Neobacillus thermocopriae]NEX79502.1 LacI family transcriptional regulator [Neobacillus thermocopriae]
MTTIKDVAREANVSISTVSRVLNGSGYTSEETRQKVYQAVEKLNFKRNMIAAAMIKKQTSTFGLIIPDIKNIFYADLTRAVEDTANQHGFNIVLCNTDNNLTKEAEYIDFLIAKGVDGIIFSTPEVKDKNIKQVVEEYPDLPVVILGSKIPGVKINEILVDNFEGGYMATNHLLELGHKKIAFISGSADSYASIERYKGFQSALADKKIKIIEDFVIFDKFYIDSGYKNGLKLLSRQDRPTAIFAASDAIAVGIYKAARELNLKIPEDLSIIGFDDSQFADIVFPPLTTIHTPIIEMGNRAMEIAIKTIKEKSHVKETIVFYPTLVERESTRKLDEGGCHS